MRRCQRPKRRRRKTREILVSYYLFIALVKPKSNMLFYPPVKVHPMDLKYTITAVIDTAKYSKGL